MGSDSRAQAFGGNPVGSKSKIPLHKGEEASSPARWGVCISKVVEAAESSMGISERAGRVSGRSLSPSITSKPFVCLGEPPGAGLLTKRRG